MGFNPSRADPDMWTKESPHHNGHDCIATFVDDLIVVAKEPLQYLEVLANKLKLRDITDCPKFFLGNDWINNQDKTRMSDERCVQECIRKFEEENGSARKESVPAPTKSHPLSYSEHETSPLLYPY